MIISLKQAVEQRSTPSDLRVLANSLERIAKDGYVYEEMPTNDHTATVVREPAYDRKACIENAAALRRLAGELHRLQTKLPGVFAKMAGLDHA